MKVLRSLSRILYAIFFRSEQFYCKVDVGGDAIFKIWERPAAWCSNDEIQQIIIDLKQIAQASQEGKDIPDYGVLSGDEEDLKNRVITIGYERKTNKPIGFSAQIYMHVPIGQNLIEVLHMGLVYVAENYKKKSLSGLLFIFPNLLLLMRRGFRPLWVSNVSQVPAVLGVVSDFYDKIYPNFIHKTKQSLMHKSLGNGIMKYHRKVFGVGEEAIYDADQQIIQNAYTGGSDNLKKTYEECQKYRHEKVNEMCKNSLDYNRGDDFLQIGMLSHILILNFFRKRIKGIPKMNILLYVLATGIFTLFIPVLKWLTRKNNTE